MTATYEARALVPILEKGTNKGQQNVTCNLDRRRSTGCAEGILENSLNPKTPEALNP